MFHFTKGLSKGVKISVPKTPKEKGILKVNREPIKFVAAVKRIDENMKSVSGQNNNNN